MLETPQAKAQPPRIMGTIGRALSGVFCFVGFGATYPHNALCGGIAVKVKYAGLCFVVVVLCGTLCSAPYAHADVVKQTLVKDADGELRSRLAECSRQMGASPVDARVDRVWHLVPGLAGWQLDQAASVRDTTTAKDGKLHLAWQMVQPSRSLASFPPEAIYRGPAEEKSISLMVNVSWGEEYIPKMLQFFRSEGVHATFFLDGKWVEAHPALAKQIAKDGHAIGSHGSGHPDFARLSTAALSRQISGSSRVIEHTTGTKVRIIAPPSGSYDKRLVQLAKSNGMYTILWTADTIDWRKPPADMIVSRAKKGLTPGCFLLMHPTKPTVEALPRILKMIHEHGYHEKTVLDVVAERPAVKPPSVLSTSPHV